MRVQAASKSRDVPCPGCEASTLLRPDSGLCERCHAKSPRARAEWAAERETQLARPARKSHRSPPGTCPDCRGAYGTRTPSQHAEYCPVLPYACICARRFPTEAELDRHTWTCREVLLKKVRG